MKKSIISIIKSATFCMIAATLIYGTSTATSTQRHTLTTGYPKDAKVGSSDQDLPCGTNTVAIVADDSYEITTGTEIWANPHMTVHYPNGVITSLSGSTYGQSFFVTNGIVGTSAEPCIPE